MFHVLRRLSCRWPALCVAPALSVGLFAAATPAHDFSADIVTRDAAGVTVSSAKLYVADRKVRIETPQAPGFFLTDGVTGGALFVRAAQKDFMDAKQSTPLTFLFVSVDPNDPCRQWRVAGITAGVQNAFGDWRCVRAEGMNATAPVAIEYHVTSPDQNMSDRWIDPTLDFPVKLRATDGTTIALEQIRVEAQPASLFVVPPGYRKFDPQALIDRIKRSDVWVDSPR